MLVKSDRRVVFGGTGTAKALFSAVLWAEDGVGKDFVGLGVTLCPFRFLLIIF